MRTPKSDRVFIQYLVFFGLILAVFFILASLISSFHQKDDVNQSRPIIFENTGTYVVDAELPGAEFDAILGEAGLLTGEELIRKLQESPPVDEQTLLEQEQLIEDLIRWLLLQTCNTFEPEYRSACIAKRADERDI